MKCIGPRAKVADLWILIWEELHRVHQEGMLVEVEHVKAHCQQGEGNEEADEPAKEGTMLDGGEMAQIRASTVQQKR